VSMTRSRGASLHPPATHAPPAPWQPDVSRGRLLGSGVGLDFATVVLGIVVIGAAVALAWALRILGDQPVVYDADNYVVHGKILAYGPLNVWGFRTFGYPAFLVPWIVLADRNVEQLRWYVFLAQLVVHFGACWLFARRVTSAFGDARLGRWTFVLMALNPFLLIMTGLLLSDLLSAALVAVSAALLLPVPKSTRRRVIVEGMVGLATLTFAVEVRPANAILLPVGALLWMIRWWLSVRPGWPRFVGGVTLVGAVAALPLLPQLGLNLWAHGVFNPLLVNSLYDQQLAWGVQSLKYATFVLRDLPAYPAVFYANPFGSGQTSMGSFAASNPPGMLLTFALHAFAMLDQDFPFPYVREIDAWYRWPLAGPGYLFFWAAAVGLVVGWRRWWRPGTRLAWAVLAVLSAAYTVVYLPTAVECRFGLPLFVLLAPAAGETVLALGGRLRRREGARVAMLAASALLTISACAWLSEWMQSQAPPISQSREIIQHPEQFLPVTRFDSDPPDRWTVEQKQTYTVRATNVGERAWSSSSPGQVILHVMFVGPGDSEIVDTRVEQRLPINGQVKPGEQLQMDVTLTAPRKEGDYRLRQVLERDGQATLAGSPPQDTPVTVDTRRRR
jgi:hypothetical protein